MSVNESAVSAANPLDSKYLSGLLDNVSAFQDHLAGNDGTPLPPSFFSPNAFWTAQEKDAFFHALSVHSRFRPDLISHEIKTKSVQDVFNYLHFLQLAASRQQPTVPYLQWRQNLSIAMEVSSEWVAMEEERAAGVIAQERDWQRELIAVQRRDEIKLLKKVSRAKAHGMGPIQRKAELKHQIDDANLRARREDFHGSLGSSELTAIGTILREASESSGRSQIEQSSSLHAPSLQHSTGHVPRPEATQTLPFSATNVAGMDNSLNPAQQRSDGNGEPPLLTATEPTPTSPKRGSMTLSVELSPASRRRHQKRLHMRRKRASASGVASIDEGLECLKPGRKKVKLSPPSEDETQCDLEPSSSANHGVDNGRDAMSVCGADGSKVTRKRYPRAKQTAINELRDLDLSADDLGRLGAGVLNLEGVAKLLSLWVKLSGDTSDDGSRISIETIQLLNVHVVWFVRNLLYRAITLREQERAFKSETKVWKLSEKAVLTREHIERAVSMANSRGLNKTSFFESIIAEMDGNVEAEKIGSEFSENGPDATSLPLHRDIYTPLVWIPEPGKDSEMEDDTDIEELNKVLLEEEELDELDMDMEMNHESGLWDKTQRSQTSGSEVQASITKQGQRVIYKSAEFIEDSD